MQNSAQECELNLNVRYLLWQAQGQKVHGTWGDRLQAWSELLATWLVCSSGRAKQILYGRERLNQGDLTTLQKNLTMDDDRFMAFQNTRLCQVEGCSIWQENIVFLLTTLQHGRYQELAEYLKIDRATLSKWKSKITKARSSHKEKLRIFFGISPEIDLEQYPLFLSIEPFSIAEKKQHLKDKIDALDEEVCTQLFPALEKLLS
ncbi:hypothetical protein [Picosynechococcus sp. PCC 73109]|uniref:hypothetical protein n=1 Tax=Picosynechococcus sp. PCC 73109 TaxID=374982 RepID=UPI000745821C|nr:hypothetical protein [Picosynechococcus sp. PCC 73109]AMA10653.1 hypothetical protein AWQ23_14490 [Picosynechococcus sp. PCC 73109]